MESKINACSGADASPTGAGTFATIASNTCSTFTPVLAEINGASEASSPIISSISSLTRSGSALGKSILLMTGNTSRSWSSARYTFANVCASIPCAASTTRIAPSHAARLLDTSYVKSTCPGVSIKLKIYSSPSLALYIIRTACDLIVMPRSRSRSILSNTCACISRSVNKPVFSIIRSASVDFP